MNTAEAALLLIATTVYTCFYMIVKYILFMFVFVANIDNLSIYLQYGSMLSSLIMMGNILVWHIVCLMCKYNVSGVFL